MNLVSVFAKMPNFRVIADHIFRMQFTLYWFLYVKVEKKSAQSELSLKMWPAMTHKTLAFF